MFLTGQSSALCIIHCHLIDTFLSLLHYWSCTIDLMNIP